MQKKDPTQKKHIKNSKPMDYLYAILTVLSQKRSESGTCPEPEILAAFSEGRLKGRHRNAIMAHLNDCTSCRRDWLLVASTLEEMNIGKATWIEKIIRKIKDIKPRYAFTGGGLGIALVTCLLLVFIMPTQSELSKMISNTYAGLSPTDIAHYNSFVSKGDDEDLQSPSDALLAYKAGLAAGQAQLLSKTISPGKKDAADNLTTLLYSMGRWVVALQCACISSDPALDEFWSQQEKIATQIQNELKKVAKANAEVETVSIVETVTAIQNAIKQIRETGVSADGCEEIALALENLENQLRIKSATVPSKASFHQTT